MTKTPMIAPMNDQGRNNNAIVFFDSATD